MGFFGLVGIPREDVRGVRQEKHPEVNFKLIAGPIWRHYDCIYWQFKKTENLGGKTCQVLFFIFLKIIEINFSNAGRLIGQN